MNQAFSDLRKDLLTLRPEIPSIDLDAPISPVEQFQQKTLRPLLKFQSDLFVAVFEAYARDRKGVFFTLSGPKRASYIKEQLHKDHKLRHFCLGMLIGQFTMEEYQTYLGYQKEIRKRAMDMLVKRLVDQLG